jgi:hypothetical protein
MPPRRHIRAVPDRSTIGDAAEAEQWLSAVDDEYLACRGNHRFPKLRLHNGKLPDGVTAQRLADRSYAITETCPDCGTTRTYSTIPDGWLGPQHHYKYDWPDGYRVPKGAMSFITVGDMKGELWRRVREELDADADRKERRRTRHSHAPGPVQFSNGNGA